MKDYTNEKTSPVILFFVKHKDKFLILKRSDKVLAYKNLWSCLVAFIDETKSINERIIEELEDETGLTEKDIIRIKEGDIYTYSDEESGRSWIRHLYLIEVSNPNIILDWEHTDFKWVTPGEVNYLQTTPELAKDLEKMRLLWQQKISCKRKLV